MLCWCAFGDLKGFQRQLQCFETNHGQHSLLLRAGHHPTPKMEPMDNSNKKRENKKQLPGIIHHGPCLVMTSLGNTCHVEMSCIHFWIILRGRSIFPSGEALDFSPPAQVRRHPVTILDIKEAEGHPHRGPARRPQFGGGLGEGWGPFLDSLVRGFH